MRTTIRLQDETLKSAKKAAIERNISLTKLIEEALQEKLMKGQKADYRGSFKPVTFRGNGLREGVDLDDSASLLDVMED